MLCALRQNKIREIYEHPFVFQRSIDDAEKFPCQCDDGSAGTAPGFHPLVEVPQIRVVIGGDQGRLHQSGTPQLAALFVNPPATLAFIGIADAWDDAEVTGQPVLIGKVIHLADDAEQDSASDLADALMLVRFLWPSSFEPSSVMAWSSS